MIEIESGVPMPEPGRKPKCPPELFLSMSVGDSFRIPFSMNERARVTMAASTVAGVKVASRAVIEDGQKWLRVWRVA